MEPAPTRDASSRRRALKWFVPLVLATTLAQVLVSTGLVRHGDVVDSLDLPLTLTGAATAAVCWWTYRRAAGTSRTVWALLSLVIALDTVANMWWAGLDLSGSSPYVSPADGLYLLTYPPLFAAVFLMARGRTGQRGVRALIDGLILAMGLGLLAWEALLVAPGSLSSAQGFLHHLVLISYPLLDLFLVGGLVGLLLTASRRGAAIRWFAAYVALFVAADYLYVVAASGRDFLVEWSNVSYVVSYACLGLAALATESDPVLRRERLRLAVIDVLRAEPRIRRIVSVRFADETGALRETPGNRRLEVLAEFETIAATRQVAVLQGEVTDVR